MKQYLFAAAGGFVNGFFGTGGGTIMLYPLLREVKDKKKANATCLMIILPLAVMSIGIYLWNGSIDWWLCAKVCIGGVAGAVVGAKVLSKVSYKIILWTYCIITAFGGLMMIFRR